MRIFIALFALVIIGGLFVLSVPPKKIVVTIKASVTFVKDEHIALPVLKPDDIKADEIEPAVMALPSLPRMKPKDLLRSIRLAAARPVLKPSPPMKLVQLSNEPQETVVQATSSRPHLQRVTLTTGPELPQRAGRSPERMILRMMEGLDSKQAKVHPLYQSLYKVGIKKEGYGLLQTINTAVFESSLVYRREPDDDWKTLEEVFLEHGGDCEEFTFLKLALLLDHGWPRGDVRLVAYSLLDGRNHLALIAKYEGQEFVLDSLTRHVFLYSKTHGHWRNERRFSLDGKSDQNLEFLTAMAIANNNDQRKN